jgi:hypothetical protein
MNVESERMESKFDYGPSLEYIGDEQRMLESILRIYPDVANFTNAEHKL